MGALRILQGASDSLSLHTGKCMNNFFAYLILLLLLNGCVVAQDQAEPAGGKQMESDPTASITNRRWRVEDIDGRGIIDNSLVTLEFPEPGRAAGRSGCNRYFGGVTIGGEQIAFSGLASTKILCVPALMDQESRYLAALEQVTRYERVSESVLHLYGAADQRHVRAVAMDEPATTPQPADMPSGTSNTFACRGAGAAITRFLGPATLELRFGGRTHVLPRDRAASGAKYSAGDVSFWNKGSEAMIEVGGERFTCTRQDPAP